MRHHSLLRPACICLALIAAGLSATQSAHATARSKALVGTWDTTVTITDCTSGAAIRSFPRLMTFHRGGTLSEWSAAGTEAAPVVRASGQGTWEHLGGNEFAYELKFLRLTPFSGPDGSIRESRMLSVDRLNGRYNADGTANITLANGFVIGPICSTETGTKALR